SSRMAPFLSLALSPERLEAAAGRSWQLSVSGPATGQGQAGKAPLAAPCPSQYPDRQSRRPAVKPWPLGKECPGLDCEPRLGRRLMLLEFALAPVAHHLWQGNAHRADSLTPPAEGGGIGQMPSFLNPDQRRRQHRAHGTRIDPAIGVTANCMIDRAVVHAGTAADAAQQVLELRAQHGGAAIVDQDDMILFRTVRILGPPRAGRESRIGGEFLPRGGAG